MAQKVVREAVVKVVANGLSAVHAQLTGLQTRLSKLAPKDIGFGKMADGFAKSLGKLTTRDIGAKLANGLRTPFEKVAAVADAAKARVESLRSSTAGLSSAATKGFAASTAGVLSLVSAADPVRFALFGQLLKVVAIELGRSFIPVLEMANRLLIKVAAYLGSMTDSQREAIAYWGKLAVVVSGAAVAFFGLLSGLSSLLGGVSAIATGISGLIGLAGSLGSALAAVGGTTFAALVSSVLALLGPVGLVVGAVAALTAAVGLLGGGLAVLAKPQEILAAYAPVISGIGTTFTTVLDSIQKGIQTVGGFFADLIIKAAPLVQKVVGIVSALFGKLQSYAANVLARIQPAFDRVAAAVGQVVTAFGPVIDAVGAVLLPLFDKLADVGVWLWGVMADGIAAAAEKAALLARVIGPVLVAGVKTAGAVIQTVIDGMISGINLLIRTINLLAKLTPAGMLGAIPKIPEIERGGGTKPKPDDKPDPKAKKPDTKSDPKFRPAMTPGKVEFVGIEEVFRNAQKAVTQANDPNNLANLYRQGLQQGRDMTDWLRLIATNTNRPNAAQLAY